MEEIIIKMYFENKMKQVDIAKTLNISKYKVSRVVTKDTRYKEEKEQRKHKNKKMHIQASIELSGGKSINSRAFRKWNSSIYKLNPKRKYYEIDKNINVSNDVPKIVR